VSVTALLADLCRGCS